MNDSPFMPFALGSRAFALRTLRPETPIFGWLNWLDDALTAAPETFADRQIVLDLAATPLHGPGLRALQHELQSRGFRIVGLTGVSAEALGPEAPRLPPILDGDRAPAIAPRAGRAPGPLLVSRNVRSGQVVTNQSGDVTIVGSVSSGAEIVAAGSIHVYGTLQGRATAGDGGSIFCLRLEAELLRVGDVFQAADDMPGEVRGRAARAWRDGDALLFAALS
jgi:septum site-determining protein MinC